MKTVKLNAKQLRALVLQEAGPVKGGFALRSKSVPPYSTMHEPGDKAVAAVSKNWGERAPSLDVLANHIIDSFEEATGIDSSFSSGARDELYVEVYNDLMTHVEKQVQELIELYEAGELDYDM